MMRKLRADRPTIVVGCTLGLVLLLLLYVILQFWLLRAEFAAEIESIEPRSARLLGIAESLNQLEQGSERAAAVLRNLAYQPGRDSAATAAAMQQDVRELMEDAGLSVSGSQILSSESVAGFDRLSLDITAEGNIEELDDAFSRLERLRPLVFTESVTVSPIRARRSNRRVAAQESAADGDPRTVTVRFQLFALRLAG